ncbi:MAG TPA: hypothetical protein VKE70_16505, partial [Candidatus Solibacter sp.]|nr:hypothetical protein [Candidatus Solibacter sp.]
MKLAMTLGDWAQALDPSSKIASSIKQRLQSYEMSRRLQQLSKMTPPELTNLSAHDRRLLTLFQMEKSPEKAQEGPHSPPRIGKARCMDPQSTTAISCLEGSLCAV